MYEADWKKIKRNLNNRDIFRAPVPIYINYQLEEKESDNSFQLVHGEEIELINSPEKLKKWYKQLDTKKEEITETINTLKQKIKKTNKIIYQIGELLQKRSSEQLDKEKQILTEQIKETEEKTEYITQKINSVTDNIKNLQKKSENKKEKINNLQKKHEQLKKYAKEKKEIDQKQEEINNIQEKIDQLKEQLEENDLTRNQTFKEKLQLENNYKNWNQDRTKFLSELKDIIPEIEFTETKTNEQRPNFPNLYNYRDSIISEIYQKLQDCIKGFT